MDSSDSDVSEDENPTGKLIKLSDSKVSEDENPTCKFSFLISSLFV